MSAFAFLGQLAAGGVRAATPVALAATGETLAERGGVINVGLEGIMLGGALAAFLAAHATGSAAVGVASGALAGAALGVLFAALAVRLAVDQVVAGVALNLLSFGACGAIWRVLFGETGSDIDAPGLAPLPLPAPLDHEPLAFAAIALGVAAWWWLTRTAGGLELRAAGDRPLAADVAGVSVERVRAKAVITGGALAGLGGADLALAHAHAFTESMTAGRGFLALAVVILGRRGPLGVLGAALLFGCAAALEPVLKANGTDVPRALVVTIPYVLTLGALALAGGKRLDDPAALGVPYRRGE